MRYSLFINIACFCFSVSFHGDLIATPTSLNKFYRSEMKNSWLKDKLSLPDIYKQLPDTKLFDDNNRKVLSYPKPPYDSI